MLGKYPELRKFVAPEIVFGAGARNPAGQYSRNFHSSRVLIVSYPGAVDAGWTADVQSSLDSEGIPWVLFKDVSPNLRSAQVKAGAEYYLSHDCDTVIAVGGGSPMDCARESEL